eukprot:1098236-Alexandrium_andersonii.AAC.1
MPAAALPPQGLHRNTPRTRPPRASTTLTHCHQRRRTRAAAHARSHRPQPERREDGRQHDPVEDG